MNRSVSVHHLYTPKKTAVQESDSQFCEERHNMLECSADAGYSAENSGDEIVDLENRQENGKYD